MIFSETGSEKIVLPLWEPSGVTERFQLASCAAGAEGLMGEEGGWLRNREASREKGGGVHTADIQC